jgi:hypothetical protein
VPLCHLEPTLETAVGEVSSSLADQSSRPLCVIARSSNIDRAEADLRRALLVTVGGNCPVLAPRQVLEVVAANFGIDASSMDIMAAAPEDFLLVLPDSGAANRVFNRGLPLHSPGFSLFFKRWTRLSHAEVASLPIAVEVELRGIPTHAWEMATVQQLLSGSCWVRSMHSDTAARRDLSTFQVSAWCSRPEAIPPVIDLLIPKPAPAETEMPPMKRGLVYPIKLALTGWPRAEDDPPSAHSSPGQGRRRRRRRSPSPPPPSLGYAPGSSIPTPREPVHSRLGPTTSHVVHAAPPAGVDVPCSPLSTVSSPGNRAFKPHPSSDRYLL